MFKSMSGLVCLAASSLLVTPSVTTDGPAKSGTYEIDPGHSSVVFCVTHFGVSKFYGRFNEISGSLNVNVDDPASNEISIKIPAKSVDTNSKDRDEHLMGPDFFNAKEFANITFESTSVEAGEADGMFVVTGDLTMHGVTKEITIEAMHTGEGETRFGYRTGFEAKFTVQRSDFGMSYGLPGALGDDVEIIFALEGTAQ